MLRKMLFFILILGIVHLTTAQDSKQLPSQEQNYYSLTADQNDPQLTTVQPPAQQFTAEKQEALDQLREARLNHNVVLKQYYETRLNEIDGNVGIDSYSDPNIHCTGMNDEEGGSNNDFNNSSIAGISHWNHDVATVPSGSLSGRIYVAIGRYVASQSDTCKIYYSTNGGLTWVFYRQWFYSNTNMDFRSSEMDIKIVYDGTNSWLYGVTPFHSNTANNDRVTVWRFNLTTNAFWGATMAWPGAVTANKYYNARLAADDPVYNSLAYVYITTSCDSLYSGSSHYLSQKFAIIQNPFAATPTITYKTANWWHGSGYSSTAYYYNDVAYYHPTSVDRVYTLISVNMTYNNLYLAWSNDFGSTVAGSISLTETNPTDGSSLASVIASGNQNLMITAKRQFSGSDWDIQYFVTTTGGLTTGSWTSGYVDFTSYQASGYPNIKWVRGTTNNFKVAYTEDSTAGTTRAFYAGWNGTVWNSPSRLAVSTIEADSTFATPVAGYRNGGGDNCLIIWSGQAVGVVNASFSCSGTVGISGNNNGIPEMYSLDQNYPNPFNPSTSIKFAVPKSGNVKLFVFDVSGKQVAELVNSHYDAGYYDIKFDASNLSSGVYFFKLEAGTFSDSKKMVLIK